MDIPFFIGAAVLCGLEPKMVAEPDGCLQAFDSTASASPLQTFS